MHKEQLEYFTLVYRTRNYSAAAKMIPMSPQGLTKSIHTLENELGVTLFTDCNGALTPTLYADEVFQFSKSWSVIYRSMKESFRSIEARERHEIRLGTSLGLIGFLGIDFLNSFHKKHPHIHVTYNESNDVYCEEGLLQGTYDFALTLSPYGSKFMTTELYKTQVYFWMLNRDRNTRVTPLSISDLEHANIGLPGKDFKIYQTIMSTCESQGITLGEVFTSGEIFWLYEYASAGKGYGFTLPHLKKLGVFSNNDQVIARPVTGIDWSFGISHLPSHSLTPNEKVFLDYCIEYAKKLL